mgnify:CR=1 FL=1
MKKHILPVACMAALLMAGGVISSCSDIDPVHSLELSRVLSPTNLSVRVRNSVNLELSWDAMDKATSYTVEVYQGETAEGTPVFTQEGINTDTYTVKAGLLGETVYYVQVKAVGEGIADSKWTGMKVTTDAEQIFKAVDATEITHHSAVIRWTDGMMTSADAGNKVIVTPVSDASAALEYTVTSEDVNNGYVTIDGLTQDTQYQAVMKRGSVTRGTVNFKTRIDTGDMIPIDEGANLVEELAKAKDGDAFVLLGSSYTLTEDFELTKSISLTSIDPTNKPTISGGRFIFSSEIASFSMSNIKVDVENNYGNFIEAKGGSLGSLTLEGCEIKNTNNNMIYSNAAANFGTITVNNCIISNIGDGGDGVFDIRKGTVASVTLTNSTITDVKRTFIRIEVATDFTMTNCTLYNVATVDNANNRGLFSLAKGKTLKVENCLFYGIGLATPTNVNSGVWGRSDKMKATATYANNYYFNCPNLWSNLYKGDYSSVATELDPQFTDAANGDFTVQSQDLKDNQVGDPRWLK